MRKKISVRTMIGLAATVVVASIAGVAVWTVKCPCNNIPGFLLLGDVHKELVTDWTFVNDVPLCQIQINTGMGPALSESELHGDRRRSAFPQLLGGNTQVLVPAGAEGPPRAPAS